MIATPLIQTFSSGELSPRLAGRTDIAQYFQSAESLLNMVVEFYGGAKKAPGTYFSAEVKDSSADTIIKRFVFSDTQAYIIEVGNLYMRFYKDNGKVENAPGDLSDFDPTSSYSPAGDFVNVGGYRTLQCSIGNLYISSPYLNDNSAITISAEINSSDALAVSYSEGYISIKLADTTPSKNSADLIQTALRAANAAVDDFYVTEDAAYAADRSVAGVSLPSVGMTACDLTYYCSAIVTGNATNTSFFPPAETSYWTRQTVHEIATSYPTSVLRELQIAQTADILYITHPSYPESQLTRTGHTAWTISQIDYATSPARPALMPSNATTTTINPSAGTGTTVLTASTAIFDETHVGSIWSVGTISGSNGYCQIISVSTGGLKTVATATVLYGGNIPTGATTTWAEAAWSGYRGYPRTVIIHESRKYLGYTNGEPQTAWGSHTGIHNNFEVGDDDDEGLSFTMDTNEIEVLKWLFPSDELLAGTAGGVHTYGTGSDSLPITPSNVRRKKQTNYGASTVKPFQIGNNVYYWQEYNRILREYAYNLDVDNFQSNEATVFSEHISETGITEMAYQQAPFNILWCVRTDGKLAAFTRQVEQKVAAWTLHSTDGYYRSVAVIPGSTQDQVWFVVEREIEGATKRFIEYQMPMEFDDQEDAFFVHSGLTLDNPKTITGATSDANGKITIVCASHGFANLDKVRIRGVVGMTELNNVRFIISDVVDQVSFVLKDWDGDYIDGSAYTDYVSDGEVRKCVNSVSGLDHLDGESVQILVDGATHPARTVASGAISLDDYYGQITVGLGYTGRITTNEIEVAPGSVVSHGKEKSISDVTIQFHKTLGARLGTADQMDELTFRDSSMFADQAVPLFTGYKKIEFPGGWDRKKQIIIEQTQCLPMHVLALMPTIEVAT